jgi:hypothetical protein
MNATERRQIEKLTKEKESRCGLGALIIMMEAAWKSSYQRYLYD